MFKGLNNLKVFNKILCLIITSVLLMGVLGVEAYLTSRNLNADLEDLHNKRLHSIETLQKAMINNKTIQALTYRYFLEDMTEEKRGELSNEISTINNDFNECVKIYESLTLEQFEVEKLPLFKDQLTGYQTERDIALSLLYVNKTTGFAHYDLIAKPFLGRMDGYLQELIDYNSNRSDEVMAENATSFQKSVLTIIILNVVAMILALGLGLVIARSISKPLNGIVEKLQEVAQGNLTVEDVDVRSKDEVGILGDALNKMLASLRTLIYSVSNMAEQVAASSEELTASAQQQAQTANSVATVVMDMAQGAEKQGNAVDDITASVEESSATIEQIAANSNMVAQQTRDTAAAAEQGKKAAGRAVDQMKSIDQVSLQVQNAVDRLATSSREIDEITNVISSIAQQTNLLALNAAIEAARAGEQGRGFAVVAEEVRKLAEQSQEAAQQITELISHNQGNINDAVASMEVSSKDIKVGIEVVNEAGKAFEEIDNLANTVSSQVEDISISIQQLAQGSQGIVLAVREMDAITKESMAATQTVSAATEEQTASVEEIASSSENLAAMAESLQESIGKFRV